MAVQVIGSSKEITENKLNVSDFSTLFLISNLSHASNSGSNELSRVKLQRTDLKGNKNYFELARGSSYHEFELPWVKLQ